MIKGENEAKREGESGMKKNNEKRKTGNERQRNTFVASKERFLSLSFASFLSDRCFSVTWGSTRQPSSASTASQVRATGRQARSEVFFFLFSVSSLTFLPLFLSLPHFFTRSTEREAAAAASAAREAASGLVDAVDADVSKVECFRFVFLMPLIGFASSSSSSTSSTSSSSHHHHRSPPTNQPPPPPTSLLVLRAREAHQPRTPRAPRSRRESTGLYERLGGLARAARRRPSRLGGFGVVLRRRRQGGRGHRSRAFTRSSRQG